MQGFLFTTGNICSVDHLMIGLACGDRGVVDVGGKLFNSWEGEWVVLAWYTC